MHDIQEEKNNKHKLLNTVVYTSSNYAHTKRH